MESVKWAIWFAAMSLVMGWLKRQREAPCPDAETGTLRHTRALFWIGAVCAGLFGAMAVACVVVPGKNGGPKIAVFFLGFAALGAVIVAEYYLTHFALTADGLRYATLTGKRGTLRWAELAAVTYAPVNKWFVLKIADGRTVNVSAMLTGLPAFAQALLAGAPSEAIAPAARPVLEETAAGRPPDVWQ